MRKELTKTIVIIEAISQLETINRPGKDPVEKKTLTLIKEDGQKGFFEVRKSGIQQMDRQKIRVGDKVEIGFVFVGNEKNGKIYNNLFVNEIILL